MRKFLFSLCTLLMCTTAWADNINGFKVEKTDEKAHIGLFLAFSGVDSKYEDENVAVEIYREALWITNKSDRTIYLDLAQCFAYYNDDVVSLYIPDKTKKKNIVTETQLINIAPKEDRMLCGLASLITGTYSAYVDKKEEYFHNITEYTEKFMSVVDELRIELENENKNSATKHLTEDEAFIKLKAAIAYSFDKEAKETTPVIVSNWVSDIILSKYYTLLPPPQQKTKSLSAKKINPAKICTTATSPFEYEEEKSPIMGYDINIDLKKGRFTLGQIIVTGNNKDLEETKYYMGSITPVLKTGNTIFNQLVIEWLGTDVDFSKIKDDNKGFVQFGKDKVLKVTNLY
ncbi:MAG: hypothetical protein J6C87_06565 [Bacteroides sp.]|nr:hypothetical protein [Bacteroides sp.]